MGNFQKKEHSSGLADLLRGFTKNAYQKLFCPYRLKNDCVISVPIKHFEAIASKKSIENMEPFL
jgi:hypothetical protein